MSNDLIGGSGPWISCKTCGTQHFMRLPHDCLSPIGSDVNDHLAEILKDPEFKQLFLEEQMNNPVTVAEVENQEVQDIVAAVEEYIWFSGADKPNPTRTKSGETIVALIKVLVAKGVIDVKDVRRALKS